ncbi:hypothetical protein [Wukongibacter sp. M2B1]|uniref:hypothetical protein n=1 Tax=Wukongibacter sp. M2B1 TaxID=3088895 RepID=UPI003D794882
MSKKLLLKGLTFLTVLTLLITSISFASPIGETKTTIEISEIDYMNQLKSKDNNELKKLGLSSEEISSIRAFSFEKAIKERTLKNSDENLKNMGYTKKQIQIMRNFKGTDKEVRALAAKANISLYKRYSSSSSDTSYLTMNFDYSWSSQPFHNGTDILAFAWSSGYNSNQSSSIVRARYYDGTNGNGRDKTISYEIYDKIPGSGCYFKVPLLGDGNKVPYGYYSKSGSGTIYLYKNALVGSAEVRFEYGHRQVTGSAKVSFPGGLSIDFNYGTKSVAVKNYEYRDN